jgi:hypothetical protein
MTGCLCRGTIHRALFALGSDYLLGVHGTVKNVAHFLH